MKVKLLMARATATESQNRGDVIEVTDAEAVRMIEAGQAEPIRAAPSAEKAIRKPRTEKATK